MGGGWGGATTSPFASWMIMYYPGSVVRYRSYPPVRNGAVFVRSASGRSSRSSRRSMGRSFRLMRVFRPDALPTLLSLRLLVRIVYDAEGAMYSCNLLP